MSSMVEEALIAEIQEKAQTATNIRNKIQTAKTSTKQKYYRKKLIENNSQAASLLQALEKLQTQKQKGVENEPKDRT